MLDLETIGIELAEDGSGIAFVLSDGMRIGSAVFMALSVGGDARYFLPCVRSRYNGRDKITYFVEGYTTLRARLGNGDDSLSCLCELVEAAIAVKENGNLSLRCIVFDMDHVFINDADSKLGLAYVPVDASCFDISETQACQAVFTLCKDALAIGCGVQSPLRGISDTPAYESGDLKHLLRELDDMTGASQGYAERRGDVMPLPVFELVSRTPGLRARHRIVEESTVIGRLPEKADFAITASATVSARHCCVFRSVSGSLSVKDLGSTNGTFVNGRALRAGETIPLPEGATLGLGTSVELLVAREG